VITGGVGSRERDIDVVLVTGAGASCAFGVNDKPMPLMGDWSDHLVRKLGQRIGYREATGLKSGMSGEAFDARLGKFLQDVEAFQRIGDLLDPSVRFQDIGAGTQMMSSQEVMEQWHRQAVGAVSGASLGSPAGHPRAQGGSVEQADVMAAVAWGALRSGPGTACWRRGRR